MYLGMPHIHMLLFTHGDDKIVSPQQVDQYISARIPYLPEMTDMSEEAKQQRRYWSYVTGFMLHECSTKMCQIEKIIDGVPTLVCKKNFPKAFSDFTEIFGNIFLCI